MPSLQASISESFVGCAGWAIRSHLVVGFEQGPSHLVRYASRFNAVEINSSFYRPHRRSTYERWAAVVPNGFRFSVKVPRSITHECRLTDVQSALERFIFEVSGLGEKLGILLVQLPPNLACVWSDARSFFRSVHDRIQVPIACEARHASWFTAEIDDGLACERIIRVTADPPAVAQQTRGSDAQAYFRLHGSPRMYYSAYRSQQIVEFANRLREQSAPDGSPWCIFDNTAAGAAIANALEMKALLDRKASTPDR